MSVVISMLRGINVGGHHMIKMEALRTLYESLGLLSPQTWLHSGNVIFRTERRDLVPLVKRIENGIERSFGFRVDVILRTPSELRDVIARNPFATRSGIDPSKLLVTFLAGSPAPEGRNQLTRTKVDPEELRIDGCELYTYFPNGMARPKLSWATIEKMLKTSGTGRNWNTVTKLLEMAESREVSR
jgi:uncharacterized protein (DUF1697 family)